MVCTARLTRSLNLTAMLLASFGRPFENKPEPGGKKKKKHPAGQTFSFKQINGAPSGRNLLPSTYKIS